MSEPRLALVTGGTGVVGPAIVDRLRREGVRVRVLTRGRLPAPWPDGSVEVCAGDAADARAVAAAVAGADWVVHAAALLHQQRRAPELAAAYERANVEAARVVAAESAAAGVTRLVLLSTISVYGPTTAGAGAADEKTPPLPRTLYARTKHRGELAARAAAGTGPLATCVLRLAAVYGPRARGNYARLVSAIRAGWFVPIGSGANRRTLVHEADVAEAVFLAASRPQAAGRVYNVSDGQVHRVEEILRTLYGVLGRPYPRWHVPEGAARLTAHVADALLSPLRRPGFGGLVDAYTEDVAVRAERIQRELGFAPRYGLEAGWRDALCR